MMRYLVLFALPFVADVYGKALYGPLTERTHNTRLSQPSHIDGIVFSSNDGIFMENGVNNHGKLMENGVTNGVDMNVKTLNTNGQNDIFNIHFPTTTVSNDDILVPSQNFQPGFAVDWPNTGLYQDHYILDNDFRMNPESQFLVHLDTIPDYVLLPKEYLFDVSASDLQVVGAQNHHSIVTGQQVDIPFSSNLHKGNIGIFPPIADSIAAHHSPESLNTHTIMNENGNGEFHSSATKVNVDNTKYISTRVGNVVTVNTEPLNNEHTFLVDSVDYANIPQEVFFKNTPMMGTRTNIPKEGTSTNILNNGTSANIPQPVRQILHLNHNPEGQSGKQQKIIDASMLQTNQQQGNVVKLASYHQTKALSRTKLPPLTDIFGGQSLFNIRPKAIKVFHMSPKQEALRRFKG